jgi:hypothetical protein
MRAGDASGAAQQVHLFREAVVSAPGKYVVWRGYSLYEISAGVGQDDLVNIEAPVRNWTSRENLLTCPGRQSQRRWLRSAEFFFISIRLRHHGRQSELVFA